MGWIKLDSTTPEKPEVWAIAEALSIEPDAVVGKLCRVWFWFDTQTENGNAPRVTATTLARVVDGLAGVTGFAEAMRRVGWLNGTSIPNFDRHNGETAKSRALTQKRVDRHRNANVTPGDATPENSIVISVVKPREEKKKKKSAIADGWRPTPECSGALAAEFSLTAEQVERYVEAFVDTCRARGYTYVDFNAAFRNCVRQDWPKLRSARRALPGRQESLEESNRQAAAGFVAKGRK